MNFMPAWAPDINSEIQKIVFVFFLPIFKI